MVKLSSEQVRVRQLITRTFVEKGRPPQLSELENLVSLDAAQVKQILNSLANNKALVLHPKTDEVWIAHPFSSSPNSFWIEEIEGKMGWWSNCAWCAMGVAALVSRPVRLISRWGGEKETFTLEVKDGLLEKTDFVVHFATPVPKLWDNVIHSCSMMLPHKSEAALNEWCERHGFERGSFLCAEKCWELSRKWYGDYLHPEWNRKSPEEVNRFFESIGLDLSFQSIKSNY
jgi:hypothetical protein